MENSRHCVIFQTSPYKAPRERAAQYARAVRRHGAVPLRAVRRRVRLAGRADLPLGDTRHAEPYLPAVPGEVPQRRCRHSAHQITRQRYIFSKIKKNHYGLKT